MYDLRMIREQAETLRAGVRRRGKLEVYGPVIDEAETLDRTRRQTIQAVEEKKAQRNALTQVVGKKKKAGEDAAAEMAEEKEKEKGNAAGGRGGPGTGPGTGTSGTSGTSGGTSGTSGTSPKARDAQPPQPPRRLLLVDNVAAFYWLDRASRREQGAPLSLHAVHHASAAKLQELSRRCRAPIVVTKATGGAGGASDAAAAATAASAGPLGPAVGHRDFLPRRWTSAVTQRLVLDVERVAPDGAPRAWREGFEGAGGYAARFVARWEMPRGRPGMRYEVHGDDGIRCEG